MNGIDASPKRFTAEPGPGPLFRLRALSYRVGAAAWQDPTVRLCLLALVVLPLADGCKLIELKMPGEPLPKEDFALRGQTREFANLLSATVQHTADAIASQTDDPAIRTHCLQWKIGAVSAIRGAALHSSPKLALVESWAFCRQMDEFLDRGAGARLFGPFQTMAVTNSQALERRLTHTARVLLSASEFSKMDKFLAEYVAKFPVQTLAFNRVPVAPRWEDFDGKPPRIPPAGTSSEALSDVAERFQILGQEVPDEVRWRLSLEGDVLEKEWARTGVTLDRLDAALKQISEAAAASPGAITNAVLDLRSAFLPVLERFQGQWDNTTRTLQTERLALTETLATERAAVLKELDRQRVAAMAEVGQQRAAVMDEVGQQRAAVMQEVDRQRVALTKDVDQQRAAAMKETQEILRDLVDRSLTQVHGVIRDVLFYLVLLVAIVLGLPFAFGFILGRAWGRAGRPKKA